MKRVVLTDIWRQLGTRYPIAWRLRIAGRPKLLVCHMLIATSFHLLPPSGIPYIGSRKEVAPFPLSWSSSIIFLQHVCANWISSSWRQVFFAAPTVDATRLTHSSNLRCCFRHPREVQTTAEKWCTLKATGTWKNQKQMGVQGILAGSSQRSSGIEKKIATLYFRHADIRSFSSCLRLRKISPVCLFVATRPGSEEPLAHCSTDATCSCCTGPGGTCHRAGATQPWWHTQSI